jgi:hypothetical protein
MSPNTETAALIAELVARRIADEQLEPMRKELSANTSSLQVLATRFQGLENEVGSLRAEQKSTSIFRLHQEGGWKLVGRIGSFLGGAAGVATVILRLLHAR